MKLEDMKIVENIRVAHDIYKLVVQGSLCKEVQQPGQFVHIRVSNQLQYLLRRPISISNVDLNNRTIELIYQVNGAGTNELALKQVGETVNILGPLGNGYSLDDIYDSKQALIVGGGVGIPPLYYLSKKLKEKGVKVKHVLGFRSEKEMFYKDEFEELGETWITTNDGSFGYKGFVTEFIKEKNLDADILYACGPTPMLKAIETELQPSYGYISLEERMGCGIGACFACVCETTTQPAGDGISYRKICADGPVFKIGEVKL